MADKFTNFASKMGKAPKGLGLGASALIAVGGLLYAGNNALFTGERHTFEMFWQQIFLKFHLVEGGHRAIMFNRIGGIDMNTVHSEGLHFRIPYFQYPILYDIRARPRLIKSPTGSKGKPNKTQIDSIGL